MFGMNIKDLIGEAIEYDKKLALEEKKPKSWCKSVSAFANTFGGALIFGISNEGMVVGLEDPESDAEKISEVIKTRLDPMPEFKLRFHKTDDGKVLVVLDVYKGDETPYYYSGDGVLEAFVRIGNESVKATATELNVLSSEERIPPMIHRILPIRRKIMLFQSLRKDIRSGPETVSTIKI